MLKCFEKSSIDFYPQKLAMVRILLAQRLLSEGGEDFKEDFDREMALAVNEFKKASVCIGS